MEKYLRKCLNSLIIDKELMPKFEVLIINDGSKDSSSQIAHEYETKYFETFRVIDKENGNYGSCINRGLKESTGKYIKILDADDWFNTDAFVDYLSFLCNQDCDLVLNDCIKINEKGNQIGGFKNLGLKLYTETSFEKFANKNIFPQMHCIAYKRENLNSLNYKQTEGISYTDQEWATIPMQNVKTVIYANLPLYYYLIGREGQTMSPEILHKSFEQQKIVVLSIINHTIKSDTDNIHKSYLEKKTTNFLKYLYYGHFVHSLYDDKEFRLFDQLISKTYPSLENILRDNVLRKVIKHWRTDKSFPFYIQLYLYVCKIRS